VSLLLRFSCAILNIFSKIKGSVDFNKAIIDATNIIVRGYKIIRLFYEAPWQQGREAMEETVDYIPVHI
jgi:hypothetical protein